jgi:hypothetical protein
MLEKKTRAGLRLPATVACLAAIAAFSGSTISGQSAAQAIAEGCMISGRILNGATGESVHGASVDLTDASQAVANLTSPSYVILGHKLKSTTGGAATRSADDGTFCLQTAQSGRYLLNVSKLGFLDSSYGAKGYLQTGSIIAVGNTPLRNLDVTVEPMSGIVGRVIDPTGEAVVDANVVALKQLWLHGRQMLMPVQGAQSDERGAYRIGKLTPGVYFVYARPIPSVGGVLSGANIEEHVVRTYYPSALRLTNGTPVTVRAGQDVSGIDIRVVKASTYHVRGKIDGTRDQWPGATIRLLPGEEEPLTLVLGVGNIAPNGSFEFSDISPGAYKVDFESRAGAGQLPIEVEDADVSVALHVTGNASLRGKIAFEAIPTSVSISTPKITLKTANAVVGPTYGVNVDNNGSIAAERIRPGKYFVDVALPPGMFLKSVKAGTSELANRELDLMGGGTVELSIALRYGTGTVNVSVTAEDAGTAASPRQILLAAFPPTTNGFGMYFGAADSSGQLSLTNIPPGKYRLVALPQLDARLFDNLSFLRTILDLGAEVELQESENKSVQVTPVPNDAIEQLLDKTTPE